MVKSTGIRHGNRTAVQKYITDPTVALAAVFFWCIFALLPVRCASGLGAYLGAGLGYLMNRRNKIALINLKIAFPDKTDQERYQILRRMWRHWGRFYAEMPHTKKLFQKSTIMGLDNFIQAVQDNKGGFICSAHLGNWELAATQPLWKDIYLNPVYRQANNPWLDKLMFQRRHGVLIPKGPTGARRMLEVLRNKGFVVMLCDQKLREGIDLPFFGHPAKCPSAIATLALRLNVPILMARSIRQPNGQFRLEIMPPLPLPKTTDKNQAISQLMQQINQVYENWIRENPEQWLWIHRRYHKSVYQDRI